jgi:hypothetical protein
MANLRSHIASGSTMSVIAVFTWLGSAAAIGANSLAAYGAPAADSLGQIVAGATWLSAPVIIGAVPAWFLARAAEQRGLGPEHGRLTRWFGVAWVISILSLIGLWLLLLWHASASPEAPGVDLPVLIMTMWCTALTAYVPVLIALQARRREAEQRNTLDTAERDAEA